MVTIDMHRGHLDPVHATLPVPREIGERVLRQTAQVLEFARQRGIPVVHVILTLRPAELSKLSHRFPDIVLSPEVPQTDARRKGTPHNLQGSVQTELMPELGPHPSDYVIDNKKTFNAFLGTDLEHLLRVLEIDAVVFVGINTNTCVLSSAFEASNLGFRVVVLSDCVASMYGDDLHVLALENVARCIGWVLTADEFREKIGTASSAAQVADGDA